MSLRAVSLSSLPMRASICAAGSLALDCPFYSASLQKVWTPASTSSFRGGSTGAVPAMEGENKDMVSNCPRSSFARPAAVVPPCQRGLAQRPYFCCCPVLYARALPGPLHPLAPAESTPSSIHVPSGNFTPERVEKGLLDLLQCAFAILTFAST